MMLTEQRTATNSQDAQRAALLKRTCPKWGIEDWRNMGKYTIITVETVAVVEIRAGDARLLLVVRALT